MGRAQALISLALAACVSGNPPGGTSVDAPEADARPDAAIDADLVSFQFKGTYLDWDSSAAAPCPIPGAKWTARYDDHRFATTDAQGAFTIPLASYTPLLDLKQPAASPTCANPAGAYPIKGIAITPPAVFYAGGTFTARTLTMARATAFYTTFASTFDPAAGALLVHVNGAQRPVSISSTSDPAQAFNGSAWSAGATGLDVFFPNIPLGPMMQTTVMYQGGALGLGSVPLEAGTITYLAIVAN